MIEFQSGWGWQPALYLFLGGLAGGAFIVAALIKFFSKGQLKTTVAGGMGFALVCLILGLIILITDVSQPLRAMMMWNSFSNFGSWMTIGAWLLFAAALVFAVATILNSDSLCAKISKWTKASSKQDTSSLDSTGSNSKASFAEEDIQASKSIVSDEPMTNHSETSASDGNNVAAPLILQSSSMALLNKICTIVGMILALGVVVYTGILLASAPGITFWNSWILPLLFTLSALDTGVAAMIIISIIAEKSEKAEALRSILEKATLILIVCEIAALTLLLLSSNGIAAAASVDALVSGWLMVPFWILVIVIGLLVPFAIALISLIMRKKGLSKGITIAGSCCILVGGCALRLVIIYAGAHIDMASVLLNSLPY